jgi:hypothetical protein
VKQRKKTKMNAFFFSHSFSPSPFSCRRRPPAVHGSAVCSAYPIKRGALKIFRTSAAVGGDFTRSACSYLLTHVSFLRPMVSRAAREHRDSEHFLAAISSRLDIFGKPAALLHAHRLLIFAFSFLLLFFFMSKIASSSCTMILSLNVCFRVMSRMSTYFTS